MSKLHQANDEKPGVPSGRQGDKQEESKSHDLVKEPSFPLGSIGTGKAWQFKGDYEQPSAAYPYVALYPEAQLWQDIVLPVAANPVDDARPDYWVGWEYDTGSLTDCTLTVHDFSEGKEGALLDTLVMEGVKATPPAHGLPPVPKPENVNWTTRDLQRIKGLHSGITAIRIKFEAGDGRSYLNLRNTDLDVRLPELKAKVTLVVDPDGLKIEQAAAPYQFCHGAEHRLEVSGDEAGSWLDQPVALSWHEDKLPIELALQAAPPFQRGDVDGDSFQNTLSATKTAWTITSSADATTASVPLSLGLKSWWQAAIGKHDANVGDYVYGLSKIEGGEVALVIDDQNANSATLTTYVSNFFVPGRSIKGAQVQWLVNGVPFATEPSDERGQVLVKYTAQKGDEGTGNEAELKAICTSLEGYSSEKNQKIRVFASSPWADEVEVWLNGKQVDMKTGGLHLTLGSGEHKLQLKPKGGFFIDKEIALQSPGGNAEELGIGFSPSGSRRMTDQGLEWTITSGNQRGVFVLDAVAAGLNVPFSLEGGQTSANLADEVDFKVAGVITQKPPVFWRSKAQVFSMVPKPDSPLKRLALKATLTFVDGSVAKPHMSAVPEFGKENAQEESGWSWSLTGGAASGTFGLSVSLEGFSAPVSLAKAMLLSTRLDDEMLVTVKWLSPSSEVFYRGLEQEVRLVPRAGSPIADASLKASLTFVAGTLAKEHMKAEPDYAETQDITASGASWLLTGQEASGTFGFKFSAGGFSESIEWSDGALLSTLLSDELDLEYSSQVLQRGKAATFSVRPKPESPLAKLKLRCKLELKPLGPVTKDTVSAEPNYAELVDWVDGRIQWLLTGKEVSGYVELQVVLEGDRSRVTSNYLVLVSTSLIDEADLIINGKSVQYDAFMLPQGEEVTALVRPKPGSPVERLSAFFDYFTVEVPSTPERIKSQRLTENGATWKLTVPAGSQKLKMGFYVPGIDGGWEREKFLVLPSNLEDSLEITRDLVAIKPKETVVDYYKAKSPVGSVLAEAGEEINIFYDISGPMPRVSFSPGTNVKRTLIAGGTLAWDVIGSDFGKVSGAARVIFQNRLFDRPAPAGTIMWHTGSRFYDLDLWVDDKRLGEPGDKVDIKSRVKTKFMWAGIDDLLRVGAEVKVAFAGANGAEDIIIDQTDGKTFYITATKKNALVSMFWFSCEVHADGDVICKYRDMWVDVI